MADKNFARSETDGADLLADDDPLAELARLVGYEPRPVQDVGKASSEPAQAVSRADNPVLALEDELMRAFEQYDTPRREGVEPVLDERAAPRHVEPVFDLVEPVAEERGAILDEVPTRDAASRDVVHGDPSFEERFFSAEPSYEVQQSPVAASRVDYEPAVEAYVAEPSPVDAVAADAASVEAEPELVFDSALLLADELETAVYEAPVVNAEPLAHAGHQFVDRLEPRFEPSMRGEPIAETPTAAGADERQPVVLGFQPLAPEENPIDEIGLDLERELELSIGDGFADDLLSEVHATDTAPVSSEPTLQDRMFDAASRPVSEPFHAAPAYVGDEPQFVAEMPFETREDRSFAMAEAETQWQDAEPARDAEPNYRLESVEAGGNYDADLLLAEVERYPVPDTRSPLETAALAAVSAAQRTGMANVASIFGRATPVAHRQPAGETSPVPAMETAREPAFEPVQHPVAEAHHEPAAMSVPAIVEPEPDFDNLDFDLSDIDLSFDEETVRQAVTEQEARLEVLSEARVEGARPVEMPAPVHREPAVAVPVSTYTAPQPVIAETADGALPFDPAMIADTGEGVSPVTELDVPQLPVIEKEKPSAYQPDYDFDIDAEMAQLFTEPAAKARSEDLPVDAVAQPVAQINDVDDFERALEEDFRRSLNQPERMAIPVDPGQANTLYAGDGYDEEQSRPRRGLLIAASVAALFLVGGGGVYAWTAFTGDTVGSGEPRVILADKDPIKVVPEEKGGKTVPNQDKAVYDRVAGDAVTTPQQEQLVTTMEEPVDVVQRTLTPETLPFDGPEDGVEAVIAAENENRVLPGVDEPETAVAEGGNKPLVSPRKVKTMIVKPDGTLVAREETVSEPAAEVAGLDAKATATTSSASGEAAATANAAVDTNASLSAEQAAGEGQPRSVLAEVANAEVDDTAPVRTVKTTTIGATTGSTDGNAPVPGTRPIDQPVNVVGTVTENGNVSGTQTQQAAEQTQVAAVAPGSYVIQIASLPSEAEAQKSYNSLSSRFSSVIGGRGVDIKKAEIPNKGTFFRVRIPVGSREEANALCSRYKSAGGSCLVTR